MRISWCFLGLSFCLALASMGCNSPAEGKSTKSEDSAALDAPTPAEEEEEITIPVEAALPQKTDVSAYFETTSRVEAERRVEVMAQGMGECIQVSVEEGDSVQAGQVLAELDKEELLAQIRQTRVNVKQQENALRIAEQALRQGIGAEVERDNAHFSHEQALATLSAQEVQLKNQTITSPISGLITRRNIQQGSMVSSAMPAFIIVDPSSYRLPVNIPERELARLSPGQEVRVTIDSNPGEPLVAKVDRISPSVDPASGTVRVLLAFDQSAQAQLREAAFARVRLVMDTHQGVLVVPKDSVVEDSSRKYLMVVRELSGAQAAGESVLVAERVEVQTGLEDGNQMEIISGIAEDTRFVTLGQHTLKDGARVNVTNAAETILSRAGITPRQALQAAEEKREKSQAKADARKQD